MNNTFTTVLQDLVFGLFGAITLQVVIFSIFVDAHDSRQDHYVCVVIEWVSQPFLDETGRPLEDEIVRQVVDGVALTPISGESRKRLTWSVKPHPKAIAFRATQGEVISTLYFVDFHRQHGLQRLRLLYPVSVTKITIQTKAGVRHFRPGQEIQIALLP